MEHSQTLMHPQPIHCDFGVAVELIEDIYSLNDLTDVTHIEDIVRFGWSRQEILRNCLVKVDSCDRESLSQWLDFIFKLLRLELVR